jgi:competence protein ComEC
MLSHRDSDHTGGAAAVLAQQPQAALTGSIAGEAALLALRAWTPCVAGQAWVWDGVAFELLHPAEAAPTQASRATNPTPTAVCCARARSGASALLAGDIERAQELELVQRGGALGN